jgi:RIO-like serine/threonine protein kinase
MPTSGEILVISYPKHSIKNHTSSIVVDGETVTKTISYGDLSEELFTRELFWLSRLENTGFVPKIISTFGLSIVMEHCGEVLNNSNRPQNLYEQLFNIAITLFGYHCYYNDWKKQNILVKHDKIYIIDFGWCPYAIEDYSCGKIKTRLTEKPAGNFFGLILKQIKKL